MRLEIEINDILARDITTTVVNALAANERTSTETYATQGTFEKILKAIPDIISLIKAAKQPEPQPAPKETHAGLVRLCPKTAASLAFDFFKALLTPAQMEQLNTWIETNAKSGEKSEPEDKTEDTPAPAKEE